jgi:hypothetical protein
VRNAIFCGRPDTAAVGGWRHGVRDAAKKDLIGHVAGRDSQVALEASKHPLASLAPVRLERLDKGVEQRRTLADNFNFPAEQLDKQETKEPKRPP